MDRINVAVFGLSLEACSPLHNPLILRIIMTIPGVFVKRRLDNYSKIFSVLCLVDLLRDNQLLCYVPRDLLFDIQKQQICPRMSMRHPLQSSEMAHLAVFKCYDVIKILFNRKFLDPLTPLNVLHKHYPGSLGLSAHLACAH
jgi:hypothetical protein